jgi:hypothetical protein
MNQMQKPITITCGIQNVLVHQSKGFLITYFYFPLKFYFDSVGHELI